MASCKICDQLLVIELDPEDFDEATSSSVGTSEQTVPDDLMLPCNCHFHWQCLLDESPTMTSKPECPSCQSILVTTKPNSQTPQILTRYHNEGGLQIDLDILPLITEEAYLSENPAARPARAFMTMCAEGDITGIVELLNAIEEDRDEEDMSPAELLRFQDPLDGMKTGLHIAIERSQQEAVWLLLWLASTVPLNTFPHEVVHAASTMGAEREYATQGVDLRGAKDEQGRTAEDVARGMTPVWAGLLAAGVMRA